MEKSTAGVMLDLVSGNCAELGLPGRLSILRQSGQIQPWIILRRKAGFTVKVRLKADDKGQASALVLKPDFTPTLVWLH